MMSFLFQKILYKNIKYIIIIINKLSYFYCAVFSYIFFYYFSLRLWKIVVFLASSVAIYRR